MDYLFFRPNSFSSDFKNSKEMVDLLSLKTSELFLHIVTTAIAASYETLAVTIIFSNVRTARRSRDSLI